MVLIQALSAVWGGHDEPVSSTKTVWAEVSCIGADRIPCPPRALSAHH